MGKPNGLVRCGSRGSASPRRARFVRVEVFVNGRRVLTRRGHRIRGIVLRGLPTGRLRLKIVATTNRGRRISSSRTYSSCPGD
jgi:hypothetical protein